MIPDIISKITIFICSVKKIRLLNIITECNYNSSMQYLNLLNNSFMLLLKDGQTISIKLLLNHILATGICHLVYCVHPSSED